MSLPGKERHPKWKGMGVGGNRKGQVMLRKEGESTERDNYNLGVSQG